MTGFVYKWTNSINGKWYIGSHKGTMDDGYRHSSQYLKLAEEKYGPENFIREILFEGDYEKDQIKTIEADHLNKHNAANDRMSYNQTNITGVNCASEESLRKRSASLKNRTYNDLFGKEKADELRKRKSEQQKGKTLTQEHIENLSKSHVGNIPCNRGFRYEAKIADKRTYITDIPCIRGHVSERNTSTGQCKECLSFLYKTRYKQNNKEKDDGKAI